VREGDEVTAGETRAGGRGGWMRFISGTALTKLLRLNICEVCMHLCGGGKWLWQGVAGGYGRSAKDKITNVVSHAIWVCVNWRSGWRGLF
jgi:hypothetical protein